MALHEFKNGRWVMFTPDFSNVEESRRKKAMQISGYYRERRVINHNRRGLPCVYANRV